MPCTDNKRSMVEGTWWLVCKYLATPATEVPGRHLLFSVWKLYQQQMCI